MTELLAALFHPGIAPLGAVVIGIEPTVPRGFEGAVIAVAIAVVLLMEKIAEPQPELLAEMQILEPAMRGRGGQDVELQDENRVDRVRGDEQENEHAR